MNDMYLLLGTSTGGCYILAECELSSNCLPIMMVSSLSPVIHHGGEVHLTYVYFSVDIKHHQSTNNIPSFFCFDVTFLH